MTVCRLAELNYSRIANIICLPKTRSWCIFLPRPRVAKPDGRQQMQVGCFGSTVGHVDADKNVFGRSLRVFDLDVEVSVLVEYAGVHQLKFWRVLAASAILLDKTAVREFGLRVFVQILHVRMSRC